MSDSELRDRLEAKHRRNREERIEAIKHWVDYIRANPPGVWGPQQNRLVDSQLESARETGLDAEHYRRVDRANRDGENRS